MSLCLNAGAMGRIDAESETLIPTGGFFDPIGLDSELNAVVDGAGPLKALSRSGDGVPGMIAHSLRADGFDASEDGTGLGTPLVPIAFDWKMGEKARSVACSEDQSPTLGAQADRYAVAFDARQSDVLQYGEKTGLLDTDGHTMGVLAAMQVRRLTPVECSRLQGFPDDYLDIPYRGKPAADGNKYKALGNSMAAPVMAWIGRRLQCVSDMERLSA